MVTAFIKMKRDIYKKLEDAKSDSMYAGIFMIAYSESLRIVLDAESEFYYQSLKEAGYF